VVEDETSVKASGKLRCIPRDRSVHNLCENLKSYAIIPVLISLGASDVTSYILAGATCGPHLSGLATDTRFQPIPGTGRTRASKQTVRGPHLTRRYITTLLRAAILVCSSLRRRNCLQISCLEAPLGSCSSRDWNNVI
jgi:hypothetical protein